jgi:hypothetical protein
MRDFVDASNNQKAPQGRFLSDVISAYSLSRR